MKKIWLITLLISIILAFYAGASIYKGHPMDDLYVSVVNKINDTHVIKFKSGFAVNEYNLNGEITNQWQMKREGTYDAWSKFLHYKNVSQYEPDNDSEDVEEKTSLSFNNSGGNLRLYPIEETYFKNRMYYALDRESKTWSYQPMNSYDLLELFPFDSEILNRYAKHYKSENRGKFVVLFYSVDPNYLTRTYPEILKQDGYEFSYRFVEGTIKMLVYPDTLVPRRIYSIYRIENLETGEIIEYNIDSYYSEDDSFMPDEEPAIPEEIIKTLQ